MFTKVGFKNFKSLRDFSTELQPFTVLVGPNGCGKSTVLEALECASLARGDGALSNFSIYQYEHNLSNTKRNINELRTRPFDNNKLEMYLYTSDSVFLRLVLGQPRSDGSSAQIGRVGYHGNVVSGTGSERLDGIPRARRVQLDLAKLREPSLVTEVELRADGSGLATSLANARLTDPPGRLRIAEVEERLRKIVPSFRSIRLMPASVTPGGNSVYSFELIFHGVGSVPLSDVSEGTLLALAVLAHITFNEGPSLYLIDDIDRGLHPTAQIELVKMLRTVVEASPGTQIVCTTHSDNVVAQCNPKEVIRLDLDDDGYTKVVPIDPAYVPAQMTAGEIEEVYFGVKDEEIRLLIQRHARLRGDSNRTNADERELNDLIEVLGRRGIPLDPPVERRKAS